MVVLHPASKELCASGCPVGVSFSGSDYDQYTIPICLHALIVEVCDEGTLPIDRQRQPFLILAVRAVQPDGVVDVLALTASD